MQLIPDLLSVTPGSPPRLLSVEKVETQSVFRTSSTGRTWQLLLVQLITKAPSYNGLGCSILLSHLTYAFQHTHGLPPSPPHTPSTHLLLCLPVLLTPLDGLPSCQLLPPNANTKTGSLFEQAEVYYPKYITPVLQRKNILNQHICTIYFYSKVMTGFLREFLLAIRLTKNSFAKWFMMIIIGSVCFKKNLHKCGSLQSHSALIGNSDLWMSPFPGFSTKGPLPTIFASCFPQNWGARQGKLAFLIASFLES